MLVLAQEDHMTGTAYLDDGILPEIEDAYETIPILDHVDPPRGYTGGVSNRSVLA